MERVIRERNILIGLIGSAGFWLVGTAFIIESGLEIVVYIIYDWTTLICFLVTGHTTTPQNSA